MIQKAIIEQKLDKYSMKVRIPVYNKIKSDPTATPTKELYTATIQTLPGCSPNYQEGDVVLVDFENDNIACPIIIGLLFRENLTNNGSTDITADSLTVNVNTNLSENTLIGEVTPDSLKKLNDKFSNNVTRVAIEYSLSNYQDHYEKFSDWSEQAPQYWPEKYMWQRTTVTYEDGTIMRSMTCIQGAQGQSGSGATIDETYVKYAISSNGTTPPDITQSGIWYNTPPQTTDVNPYLWSWTYTRFSDGKTNNAFGVSRVSSNSIIVYLYKRSSSEITEIDWTENLTYSFDNKKFDTVPSGWSETIPSGDDPLYVTATTASSIQASVSIKPSEWSAPTLFSKSGLNSRTILLYKRSTSLPTTPQDTVLYNFTTGKISPESPDGWSIAIPTTNGNPCYVTQATAISSGETYSISKLAWSSATILAQDGSSDYIDEPIDEWYIATGTTSTPTTPTADIEVESQWTSLGWSSNLSSIVLDDENKYLWNAEVTHYSISGYVKTTPRIITIYAEPGKGIASIAERYARNNSSTTPPDKSSSVWTDTPTTPDVDNKYLWKYEIISYTEGAPTETTPTVISMYAAPGSDGAAGLNTASVFLYQRAAEQSSITKPTTTLSYIFETGVLTGSLGKWSQSIPASDGNPCYVIQATAIGTAETCPIESSKWSEVKQLVSDGAAGKDGEQGESGVGISSTTVSYAVSSDGTSAPTTGWGSTIPTVEEGKYLWTRTITEYTDETSSTSYSVSRNGTDGAKGAAGTNGLNTAIAYLYIRSDTAPSIAWAGPHTYSFELHALVYAPTGWSQSIPDGTKPLYVTAATASSRTTTATITVDQWATPVLLAKNGEDGAAGEAGAAGTNTATVFLYKRAASASDISKPTATLTYTFATGVLSGTLSGWSQTVPASTGDPCFVIQATAIGTGATDTIAPSEWSNIVKFVEDGAAGKDGTDGKDGSDGINSAVVYLYKRSSGSVTIDWTSSLIYTFETKSLNSVPTGWSATIPSGTDPLYVTAATAASSEATDTILYTEWATPVILAQNGEDGTSGVSITGVVNKYLATNKDSGITRDSAGWTEAVQIINKDKPYLWNYEEVKYSNNTSTFTDPCIIGTFGSQGTDGVGIQSIVEWYALSTTTSRPTTGWDTTLPSMDATNRYLWNYSLITYTNGSTSGSVNDALIIGVYGESVLSVIIESDNGTLFNSKTLNTTLTASVYLGAKQLTVNDSGAVINDGVTLGQLNWLAKERFVGNGTATTFDLGFEILNYDTSPKVEVTIDGTATTAFTILDQGTIKFTTAPSEESVIIVQYLTSTSSSLPIERTAVRGQVIVTCNIVSGTTAITTAEVTVKDLNDATSLKSWYMLTIDSPDFLFEPSVIYNADDYTVTPTGEYTYKKSDDTTETVSFSWQDSCPVVNASTLSKLCYTFQMIIFSDNSCSAGNVERTASFDSAVSNYIKAQQASDSANNAQSSADSANSKADNAIDGVNKNAEELQNVQQTLTSINGVLSAKLDTVTFVPYKENIDSFIQFDVENSVMTLGKGNFKQQLSATKNSFMEGSQEVAYISNQELYINNATVNNKLTLDEQWIITFDSTNGLVIKHV